MEGLSISFCVLVSKYINMHSRKRKLTYKVNLYLYYQMHLPLRSRKPDFARTEKEKLARNRM